MKEQITTTHTAHDAENEIAKATKTQEEIRSGKTENQNEIEKEKDDAKQESLSHVDEGEKTEAPEEVKKVDIPGLGEIFYREKIVMFPERIVNETGGVKGYKRKIIPWEEIGKFCGIKSSEELHEINEIFKKYTKYKYPDRLNNSYEDLARIDKKKVEFEEKYSSEINKGKELDKIFNNDRVYQILEKLTSGGFPGKSFPDASLNHVFGGHVLTCNSNISSKIDSSFKNEQTILQKIHPIINDRRITSFYYLYDIRDNKVIPWADYLGNLAPQDVLKKIREDKNLSVISLEGLSVEHRRKGSYGEGRKHFWFPPLIGRSKFFENIVFGFGLKNKAFRKYNEKVGKLLSQLDFGNNMQSFGVDFFGIAKLTTELLSQDPNNTDDLRNAEEVDNKYGRRGEDDASHHPHIPIVLNHPNIPEPRWCLADYAAMPTKKGYNVLEMIT